MATDRLRALEIDGPSLDAQAIILGAGWGHVEPASQSSESVAPAVAWEGMVQGDGTGPQSSYFVRLYVDGTATCQCPGVLLPRDTEARSDVLLQACAAGTAPGGPAGVTVLPRAGVLA